MNAIFFHRIGHWCVRRRIPLIPRIVDTTIFLLYNSFIPSSTEIGKQTIFAYKGIGVVIHSRAKIGNRCIISQQVTIGGRAGHKNPPRIGNRVYIATGAKILGDIEVGDECVIGANAVVIHDVPAQSVVAGIPAKILKSDINIESYF